ncbi:alpha/beta hydrolase fold domain-containing protein [Mycolicibacterium flavescens]|nr:alpha/beta hydrolase fold domain-containing protein [Mycolicibacterium flavescens]
MGDRLCAEFARQTGSMVAAVDYRLAPDAPYPAALHDCYEALRWLSHHPAVDPGRIAVAGASAGGGLAAALAQLAHDRDEISVAAQLLIYPMLDDRTGQRPDPDRRAMRSAFRGGSISRLRRSGAEDRRHEEFHPRAT